MEPKDIFAAVSTTEKVAGSLYKWISGNRGFKSSVALELQENIEIIRLYVETKAGFRSLIPNLKEEAFRKALAEGFNFNSLNRGKIDSKSTMGLRQLEKYHGWETGKVIENIYTKIAVLKRAVEISDNKAPLRLGVRLQNLFKMLIMVTNHIGCS